MSPTQPQGGMTPFDVLLYGITVFCWGTSWYAMKLQVGTVAPEVSVVWRFAIAVVVMFAWATLARVPMRYSLADHARFAMLGLLLFSTNFTLFYYGAAQLPSGLLSVVFSLSSVFNMLLAALLLGARFEARIALGALAGFAGVVLMFLPQIVGTEFDRGAAIGFGLCVFGTLSFCLGNIVSVRVQARQVPLIAASAWGMLYGVGLLVAVATLRDQAFVVDWRAPYLVALVWLAVPCTVIAFACYLTLVRRIGPARAGYVTVLFPVLALAVSTVVEAYVWTLPAIVGVGLALGGNVAVLTARGRVAAR